MLQVDKLTDAQVHALYRQLADAVGLHVNYFREARTADERRNSLRTVLRALIEAESAVELCAKPEERERRGDWLVTRSGRKLYPLDPNPADICIKDIAWTLSKACRYAGHVLCEGIYSVAQHSVLASYLVPAPLALTALLHDASEYVLCDIIKPVKVDLPDYVALEVVWERAIAAQFSLVYPYPDEIKRADDQMFALEVRDLRPQGVYDTHGSLIPEAQPPTNMTLQGDAVLPPMGAYHTFMERFIEITGQQIDVHTAECTGCGVMPGNAGHERMATNDR